MLLITSKYDRPYEEKYLPFTDADSKRRALLYAFKLNKAVRAGADATAILDKLAFGQELRGALEITDATLATLPAALQASIEKQRTQARNFVAGYQREIDAYDLRDRLLALPVEEAVKERIEINGRGVNAVDHLAEVLPKYHEYRTGDGYTSHRLFEIKQTVTA